MGAGRTPPNTPAQALRWPAGGRAPRVRRRQGRWRGARRGRLEAALRRRESGHGLLPPPAGPAWEDTVRPSGGGLYRSRPAGAPRGAAGGANVGPLRRQGGGGALASADDGSHA